MSEPVKLLGIRRVRRGILITVWIFVTTNMFLWIVIKGDKSPLYANLIINLFDGLLWSGLTFMFFAFIGRQRNEPQRPRWQAIAVGVVLLTGLGMAIILLRAFIESLLLKKTFLAAWLAYFPKSFYGVTFYLALAAGIGYGVRYWALEERRRATASQLEAALARAELRAAAGKLQPEVVSQSLSRISDILAADPLRAQQLLVALGDVLHDSLSRGSSELVTVAEELECVERSLAFQREILAGGLHFTIEADPEVRKRLVPCFTVHTLVRRTLRHCLDGGHDTIDLRIEAFLDGEDVHLAVHERDPASGREGAPWRLELTVPAEAA